MATWLKQSTAETIEMGPFLDSTDGNTEETALSLVAADILVSKNHAALTAKSDATNPTGGSNAHYQVTLNTTDTGTLGRLRVYCHKTGSLAVWEDFEVVPANIYDAFVAGTDVQQADMTHIMNTILTEGGAGRLKAAFVKLFDVATPLLVSSSVMRGTDSAALASVCTETRLAELDAANLIADVAAIPTTAMRGTDSAALASALVTAQNDLNILTGSDGVTLATAQGNYAPSKAGDAMTLTAAAVDLIWDELTAGHVTASTFGKLLADVLADTNELQVDNVPGLIAALNDLSAANLQTALGTNGSNVIAELAQGVPSSTPSLAAAVMLMYMSLRNKLDVDTTATDYLEINNNAGTVITKKAVTDDGTIYSEAQCITGP